MKRIYGTGKPSKKTGRVHLPKGEVYEVDDNMAKILIEAGRATEETPKKEKEEAASFEQEKVEVKHTPKKRK